MVATARSAKALAHDKADASTFETIDKAMARICKATEGFEEVNTSATAEKTLTRARIMQESLTPQIVAILGEVMKLKEASNASRNGG